MEKAIRAFRGKYAFLSNMYEAPFEWDGRMQWQYTDMKLKLDFQGDNMYLAKLNLCSAMPYVYKADQT